MGATCECLDPGKLDTTDNLIEAFQTGALSAFKRDGRNGQCPFPDHKVPLQEVLAVTATAGRDPEAIFFRQIVRDCAVPPGVEQDMPGTHDQYPPKDTRAPDLEPLWDPDLANYDPATQHPLRCSKPIRTSASWT